MNDYQLLLRDLKSGQSYIYLQKGDLNISLKILRLVPIYASETDNECGCIGKIGTRLILTDDNKVDIYIDEMVKKVKYLPDVMAKFNFCYRICATDNDKSFYVGQLA